ncbi:hypothetical protein TNCV_263181 [Trichonephila clavipes]|nr:hypothetical protein TNCV_263181 [Trichonephila clavipes]
MPNIDQASSVVESFGEGSAQNYRGTISVLRELTVKRNGAPDNNSWLRVCVVCNSESRIDTLPWASPDMSSMIGRIQLEAGFVTKHYRSLARMIPI